jgi:hypothetical protein
MALSLNEVHKKKAKSVRAHAIKQKKTKQTKKRVTRPWEEKKVETETATHHAHKESGKGHQKSHHKTEDATRAQLLVRQVLKTAFEYKDKVIASEPLQTGLSNASEQLQGLLQKNPKIEQTLQKIDSRFKVTEKVSQAVTLVKMVEQEIRSKL